MMVSGKVRGLNRFLTIAVRLANNYNQPLSGNIMPSEPDGLNACFVGVPLDIGCSNRSGTRYGPHAIRHESRMLRACNPIGAAPFESLNVADIGDVPINTVNLRKTIDIIAEYYHTIVNVDCTPITLGGDHTITYPILKAVAEKHGPVGLVQVDAHHDISDTYFGEEKLFHGTPFRRAIEDGLISPKHMVQIGLRGGSMGESDFIENFKWGMDQGIRMVQAEDCWHKSLSPLMMEVKELMKDRPVYLTFDIDGIDPTHCPGTGGLTPVQAMEIVRGCRGMNLVGADLVEVNPLFDQSGATAIVGANLLFEMLCVLPGVKYYDFKLNGLH